MHSALNFRDHQGLDPGADLLRVDICQADQLRMHLCVELDAYIFTVECHGSGCFAGFWRSHWCGITAEDVGSRHDQVHPPRVRYPISPPLAHCLWANAEDRRHRGGAPHGIDAG